MNFNSCIRAFPVFIAGWLLMFSPRAADWPQFLGPTRNGISTETVPAILPAKGPKILWQKQVGQGFSSPVVASNRVVLNYRTGDEQIAECFDATSGKQIWIQKSPTTYRDDFGFDEGPRATPAIDSGRVYTMSAEGLFQCLDFETGKLIWKMDAKSKFSARKGFFGMACSPLVVNGLLISNIGGESGAGTIALDAASGAVKWKATEEEASYSSPVLANFDGNPHVIVFSRSGLFGLDPATGSVKFDFAWRARSSASVNAATPLVIGNKIFISSSYQTGAALLEVKNGQVHKVWSDDEKLSNHYATSVHYNGYLYGFDGRQEERASLVCIELATGKSQWRKDHFGSGTLVLASNRLIILAESGELIIAPASSKEFSPTARAQILGAGVRSNLALANGLLYARDKQRLVCVSWRQ